MARICRFLVLILIMVAPLAVAADMPEGRLMRFADIYKDKIVFSSGGDLWLVASSGGVARRITTDPGLELFPKFSPDGKWIAFTAQYDGNFNVYVMPAEGGEPKQLTFEPDVTSVPERMGPNNQVINWMPDGQHILFLSRRDTFNDWFGRLFIVSIDGGLPARLPIDKGGLTSFSPDGNKIAYNRIFRNFRTWKRYTGGMAQDIAIYDFQNKTYERITDYPGTDTYPMWHGDTIYFGSDRGPEHRINIYSYSLKTKQTKQLTDFKDYDVDWPSLGPDAIVFSNGGYLYTFDLKSQKAKKLTVYLPGDRGLARPHWANVARNVTDFNISPEGNRAVLTARGDIFTVPAKDGSIRNLTQTPGIREKYATWSPDGKWIAYLSDRSGEDEIYITPQDGMGREIRITYDGKMTRMPPRWSPDSKKLLFADKDLRLFYVDIDQKAPVLIDQGKYFDITEYVWSPDSKWVAYTRQEENNNNNILLYSLADKKITPVTTSFNSSSSPTFDPAGKYLFFVSQRDYNEVTGVYDFEFANPKADRVYVVTLRADLASPFAPKSDEGGKKPDESADKGKEGEKDKKEAEDIAKNFRIDLAGIENRVVAVPMPVSNIMELQAGKSGIYYSTSAVRGLSGPLPGEQPAIHVYDLKERKDSVLLPGAASFEVSFDGSKLLYSGPGAGGSDDDDDPTPRGRTFGIIDAKPSDSAHKVGDGALNLASLSMHVDPRAEWKQMFNEAWRQERDFFFTASMNGVDWPKERERYAALLPYAANRYDITYLLGEMLGELANSHTYAGGGDYPNLHPVNLGLLGVDYEFDAASGLYRIKKIYPGENWDAGLRSPLTEPGVVVKEGDYLIAVNGRELKAPQAPSELFINTAGETVTLTANSSPTAAGARNVLVKPIASEYALRQLDMINTNRRKVEQATGGRVGYIYIPDMEGEGLNEFVKQFFPQIRKEGLIIDVRYNGGGFVDQLIFERLRRILAGMDSARNFASGTIPDVVFNGSMACITNAYAASDGDIFSYYFKKYHLGPLIGMRTWGGVRGIRGFEPLLDGGYITRPEFSVYGLDSKWVIENYGVAPDIEIDNTPDLVMKGQDPQLEKAIEVVMKAIKDHPKHLPPRPSDLPAYPNGPG
ncbi:MAG: PDZ domain-containing protein [Acidobacteriota bacterium]|nr:PDZ domain-containing protein [Acidobacteriota bacterium]